MRRDSNFAFGIAFLAAPSVLACCIWALAKVLGSNVDLAPMILLVLPLQLLTAWAVWRNRDDLVSITYDPTRHQIGVRRISSTRSFSCKVSDLTIEVDNAEADLYLPHDPGRHIHRVRCGSQTVLTCRSFSQSKIRSMVREWCSTTGDHQPVGDARSPNDVNLI
ncbi:MAG: hypothetical protein ACR2RV_02320 [Verrucomicrobiales bacterium]